MGPQDVARPATSTGPQTPGRERAPRPAPSTGEEVGALTSASADPGHAHSHGPLVLAPGEARRARILLTALVLPLLIGTVVGLAALWPRGETPMSSMPLAVTGMTLEGGVITEGPGGAADPNGLPQMAVELRSGDRAGETVPVAAPPEVMSAIDVGDRVQLMASGDPGAEEYALWDFDRAVPVGWLAAIYLLAVAFVARLRGLAAVVGLAASLGVIVVFVLPAIMLGQSPLLVALVGSSAMMFLAVYLAHGISIRTTTALLGTFVGLAITVALAGWGTDAANLTGTDDAAMLLQGALPNLSLSDLLLGGIVIASLGALNDVTITQASAVWELHAANPATSRRQLFGRSMRIGRDHIASTVYTLAFAYVGTALPILLLASLWDRPFTGTLLSGEIAEEVVRTLVSSVGLVLAIPVTTGIATVLARTVRRPGAPGTG